MKTLTRGKGERMWGGGSSGIMGGGGGTSNDVSKQWVDGNYVSKDYFNQLFKVKVAVRVLVTDPSTTPETVISDTGFVARQDLLYPNEVPENTQTTDEETGYVTSTTYAIDSIQVMGGLWTNSYLSALGQNPSGGGGGGGGSTTLQGLLDVNIPATMTQANDGQVLMYDYAQNKWINATIQQSGGTVTSITAGTGLSGGTITGSGTIAINSTYQTYISHGETAYGWGNHANAGYATQTWVTNKNYLTSVAFSDLTSHPTTLSGYGITDAVGSGTTWWGQSISNGSVSGSLTSVGSITSNTRGSIDGFNKIEFYSTTQSTGTGGGIYFHFPGVSGYSSAYIQEATQGILDLYRDVSVNRDLTVGQNIYTGGNYVYMNKSSIALMIEGGITDADTGETRASFGFHTAAGTSWQDTAVLLQLKRTDTERVVDVPCGILRIGDVRLVWDSYNNALKVIKNDGTAGNLYATGGVSALGMQAGVSAMDAMTFNYLKVNNRITLPLTIIAGTTATILRQADDSDCIYMLNSSANAKITNEEYYYNQYDNVGLRGTNYNYDEQWWIDPDGCARFQRLYLDGTRYLYVLNGTLYYYNGSTSKQVAFTN